MLIGIIFLGFGLFIMFKGSIVAGLIFAILGGGKVYCELDDIKLQKLELEEASIDRSKNILDEIGGIDNIEINLSKYCYASQLMVLKNKTIHIGHNNYQNKKTIDFNSIIKLEIRVNNAKYGTAYEHSNNKVKDVIESIIVYIHTNEYTEELVFKYNAYELDEIQLKYNEILKDLKRLKVMLGDMTDTDDSYKENTMSISGKSIPEQLKEYKELLDTDIITEEEFEKVKKRLLNI